MGAAIGDVLGYAVGIAVSPIPIAAVILMLFSSQARVNSTAFMLAWVFGIALVTTVVVLIPGLGGSNGEPSAASGWVKLALAMLLSGAGIVQFRNRPAEGDTPAVPKWMEAIDGMKPGGAAGIGFLLSAVNPKNLLLAAAGGATIASAALSTGETVGVIAVFVAVAAATVVVPVVAYLLAGHRLDEILTSTKDWLIRNNSVVMSVLFVVFGFSLLGDAVSILFR